jgi:hypothetical protein
MPRFQGKVEFTYEVDDGDFAIQYSDEETGIRSETSFLSTVINSSFENAQIGVVTVQPLDSGEDGCDPELIYEDEEETIILL